MSAWRPAVLVFCAALLAGAGCTKQEAQPAAPASPPRTDRTPKSARTAQMFDLPWSVMDVASAVAELGPADRDAGSGVHVYEYDLPGDAPVRIGSADGKQILYVRHGDAVLYQRE